MRQQHLPFIFLTTLVLVLAACSGQLPGAQQAAVDQVSDNAIAIALDAGEEGDDAATAEEQTEVARPAGWTEASHSNDVDPNYDVVFPRNAVNTITITISPENWEAMQADMTELLGERGTRQRGRGGSDGRGISGDPDMVDGTPIWVPADIEMDGITWTSAGIRYKGNSSLTSAWSEGTLKMPFKLDFDEFEDDYPEIDNQRFYGFKQLSFANGFSDDSYMRETLAYDMMQNAGIMSSETAFYNVVLDYGEGPVELGIYTAVEVIDDTVISNALGNSDGNIYEAEGVAASLAAGTFDQIADSFQKENNEDAADWGDVEALYEALHADTRTTDPEQWRTGLEAVFDVDTFLNWLAVSAVIANWDTYGAMNHNYYLYDNPQTGQLVWIPWDHNMILSTSGPGGFAPPSGGVPADGGLPEGMPPADGTPPEGAGEPPTGGTPPESGFPGGGLPSRGLGAGRMPRGNVSLDRAEVDDSWPLIRYLLDDPVYSQIYRHHLENAAEQFDAAALTAQYQAWSDLLAPFIAAVGEEEQFQTAVDRLIEITAERDAAVAEFLEPQ